MNVDVNSLLFIYFPKVYVSERMAFLELRLGFAGDRAEAGITMFQELASGLVPTSQFSRSLE
jgi:hypothetical protein